MKDKVLAWLRNRGMAAAMIALESSAADIKNIHDGGMNLVFGSSEALLNSHKTVFRELKGKIKAVFIDENHCIAKW